MESMDKELTVHKMGAESLADNTPNAPEFICPIFSAQAQKFEIFEKKTLSGCP